MEKLFLVDAYALIYRSYYAFLKSPMVNSKGFNTSAVLGFVNTLRDVVSRENPTHLGVAFDLSSPTFRHKTFPEYKIQREAQPEAISQSVPIIKEILSACQIPFYSMAGYEADDIIGTLALKASHKGLNTFILTSDKDYCQLVRHNVQLYRPNRGGHEYEIMGITQVNERFGIDDPIQVIDILALMGDTSDNIPGCPGIGEKTASKLIKEYKNVEGLFERVKVLKGSLQEKIEKNKDQINLSKYLATICTDVPVELDLEKLKIHEPKISEMREIYSRLEFKNIPLNILKYDITGEKSRFLQPDLFEITQNNNAESSQETTLSTLLDTPHTYHLVEEELEMQRLCKQLLTCNAISFATITNSSSVQKAELIGLSFSIKETEAWYVPVEANKTRATEIVKIFKPLFEDEKILKIGHNVKYDIEVLFKYGQSIAGKIFDTMIAHYLVQPELRHNLDYMVETLLGYRFVNTNESIDKQSKTQTSLYDIPYKHLCNSSCQKVDAILRLKTRLLKELEKRGSLKLFDEIEMPLLPVLARMELHGIRIDTKSLSEISHTLTKRLNVLEQKIYDLAGIYFNIASPKQVGEVLFDHLKIGGNIKKTRTGQAVTSEEVLKSLQGKHPIIELILSHRGLKKLLGTYIDALPSLVNPNTGRIHTSFNQAVTATGRLSSSDPNLQNIPVRGQDGREIRRAFIPEPGCLFFSADYSQVELRIMAHLSKDKAMIDAFKKGIDIHLTTAARIYNIHPNEVGREQRAFAKRANFGIIYGITAFGLAEQLAISRQEAKSFIESYFSIFPDVKEYIEQCKDKARSLGYVETLFGRRRYLPDIISRNKTVRSLAERNAVNAPIQGTAADIIKIAMKQIDSKFRELKLRSAMILQVHDELNFSVFPEEKEIVESIVIKEMQSATELSIPLVVDCGWGNNWLEAH